MNLAIPNFSAPPPHGDHTHFARFFYDYIMGMLEVVLDAPAGLMGQNIICCPNLNDVRGSLGKAFKMGHWVVLLRVHSVTTKAEFWLPTGDRTLSMVLDNNQYSDFVGWASLVKTTLNGNGDYPVLQTM